MTVTHPDAEPQNTIDWLCSSDEEWAESVCHTRDQGVWSRFCRREELRQPPFMTVNKEQQLLLIFSIPCTARSCSSVVQRALIFWFDYKIKKKFPSEDVKADIFPTCFSKTFHQITDMRLTCWLMGFTFRRAKRAPSYLLSTHKDNARKMHPFGDWTTPVLHSFSSTMFLFTDISYITDPVLAQFLTFKRLFSRASVTLIFLGFTLNKSYAFFHNNCTNQTKNGGETQVWKYFFKFPKQKMIHW